MEMFYESNRNCDVFDFRDEIAGCIEKAYEQIQFSEATRVLFFSSKKEMTEYAKKVCSFSFTVVALNRWTGIKVMLWGCILVSFFWFSIF